MGTPEAFAAAFLTAAETGMLGVESPDYTEDLRTRRIGRALRAAGVHEVEILGGGSFGMAGATQDGRVVKLTTDESEVEAGSVLRGQRLPHVVHIDGSWFVRRTRAVKWNTGVEHRVGMLLMERVEPVGAAPDGNAVTIVWSKVRETYNATPWKLVKMNRADARATLYAASKALERQLRDIGSKLAVDVADGLRELRDHKVYGIDVHAGNIGYSARDGVYKLFDIGASSSPDTANPGELPLETETAPRGMTEEGVRVEEIGDGGAEETPRKRPIDPVIVPIDRMYWHGTASRARLLPRRLRGPMWFAKSRHRAVEFGGKLHCFETTRPLQLFPINDSTRDALPMDDSILLPHDRLIDAIRASGYDGSIMYAGDSSEEIMLLEPSRTMRQCEMVNAARESPRGRRKRIRLDRLIVNRESLMQAFNDVAMRRGSRTKGPLDVWYKPEFAQKPVNGYMLTDGHHRLVEQMLRGPEQPFTWMEVDVRQVGSGYNDYYATPAPEQRVRFAQSRYGGLEALADREILENVAAEIGTAKKGAAEDRAASYVVPFPARYILNLSPDASPNAPVDVSVAETGDVSVLRGTSAGNPSDALIPIRVVQAAFPVEVWNWYYELIMDGKTPEQINPERWPLQYVYDEAQLGVPPRRSTAGAAEAPRKTALTRADCSHIQSWLFEYLSTDVDPYDFNFAIKDWIEQEEITDNGTPYAEPTDVMPEDLSPDQLKAFTKWLKKSGELDLYTREMPFEAPAYLILHAKTKLPPGSWFMHFTDAHFDHFTQGATLDGLHLSTWKKRKDLANCSRNLSDTQGLAEVVFGFAYAAENLERMQDVDAGARKYGRNAVIFQCDCAIEAYHDGDDEFQSLFPVCAEYNLHGVSIDHAMGLGLDDDAGNTLWFKNLPELIAHLETKPKRRRARTRVVGESAEALPPGVRTETNYPKSPPLDVTARQLKQIIDGKYVGFLLVRARDFLMLTTEDFDRDVENVRATGKYNGRDVATVEQYNAGLPDEGPPIWPPLLNVELRDERVAKVTGHEGRHRALALYLKNDDALIWVAFRLDNEEYPRSRVPAGYARLYYRPGYIKNPVTMSDIPAKIEAQFNRRVVMLDRFDSLDPYTQSTAGAEEEARKRTHTIKTGFYHASYNDLPVGTILEGRFHGTVGRQPVEKLLETIRPSSHIPHDEAVFMVRDPHTIGDAGGGGGGDFLYEVEPIGQVSGPFDGGWWSEISKLSFDYRDRGRTRDLVRYADAVAMAKKYWDGIPCHGDLCAGVPEYLAAQAKIVRRVTRRRRAAEENIWDDAASGDDRRNAPSREQLIDAYNSAGSYGIESGVLLQDGRSIGELSISAYENQLEVSKIAVDHQYQGRGYARGAMLQLAKVADELRLTVVLTPADDFGASKTRLKAFYKTLGFVENRGRNKDFAISDTMYRRPARARSASEAYHDRREL